MRNRSKRHGADLSRGRKSATRAKHPASASVRRRTASLRLPAFAAGASPPRSALPASAPLFRPRLPLPALPALRALSAGRACSLLSPTFEFAPPLRPELERRSARSRGKIAAGDRSRDRGIRAARDSRPEAPQSAPRRAPRSARTPRSAAASAGRLPGACGAEREKPEASRSFVRALGGASERQQAREGCAARPRRGLRF